MAALRGLAGFSLVFCLVRGPTGFSLHAMVPNCAVALSLAAAAVHTTPVQGAPHTDLIIEQHHAFLGHVPDRIARTLAADAGILHAAIGELVGAPGRAAVDD